MSSKYATVALASFLITGVASAMRLPLYFEENRGQASREFEFVARTPMYSAGLRSDGGAALVLPEAGRAHRVSIVPVAGSTQVRAAGELRLGSRTHFYGGQALQRHEMIPHFSRVRFSRIYPGIDLFWHARDGQLEYEFCVDAGADPKQIQLRVSGGTSLRIDSGGDLLVDVGGGELRLHRPFAYQEPASRKAVPVNFQVRGNIVGFRVGSYDRSRALFIDPVLNYSSYIGGAGFDAIHACAADSSGIYIAGETASIDFPGQRGTSTAHRDAFVTKLSPDGRQVLYTAILSSSGNDVARAISLAGGAAYVAGTAGMGNFPVVGAAAPTGRGAEEAFVARLDSQGMLTYSMLLAGGAADHAAAIAVDAAGAISVAGYTASPDFPTTAGSAQDRFAGGMDAFVARLSPGAGLHYSTFLGGAGLDLAHAMAVNASGEACIAGFSSSTDLPVKNALKSRLWGAGDALAACLNTAGTAWNYVTYIGGNGVDQANGLALDPDGSTYLTGTTFSDDFPVSGGAVQAVRRGDYDAFVMKLNAQGNSILYSTLLGGSGSDSASGITVDAAKRAWIAGYTASVNFPQSGPVQNGFKGGFDGFVAQISADGRTLEFASYLGGAGDDRATSLALNEAAGIYVGGWSASPDFPVAGGSLQARATGYSGFIMRLGNPRTPDVIWRNTANGNLSAWFMGGHNGGVLETTGTIYPGLPSNFEFIATADFDGNGWPDYLWYNQLNGNTSVWLMNGTYSFQATPTVLHGPAPRPAGIADFNGDGRPDIVFRDMSSGAVSVCMMGGVNGLAPEKWVSLTPTVSPLQFRLEAAADVNRDGKPDLLWRNLTNGNLGVWFMEGPNGTDAGWMGTMLWGVPLSYDFGGIGDFDGDGTLDIIWHDRWAGIVDVWYLGGSDRLTLRYVHRVWSGLGSNFVLTGLRTWQP